MRWTSRRLRATASPSGILTYESALKADKFVLIAHGTAAEVARAKEVLGTTSAANLMAYAGAA